MGGMIFMINNSIVFSLTAKVHIDKYDGVDHTYWNVNCPENSAIRKEIREYYRGIQNFHCPYCNRLRQDFNGGQWDIDHIIAKQTYPEHLYTPKNLAATCKDCNGKKSNKNVLAQDVNAAGYYPSDQTNYIIVHPHFDDYNTNIESRYMSDGKIYHIPLTEKGRITFDICGLQRFTEQITETTIEIQESGTILDMTDDTTSQLRYAIDELNNDLSRLPVHVQAEWLRQKLSQISSQT